MIPPITIQEPTTMAMKSKEKERYEMSGEGGKTVARIGPMRTIYRIIMPTPEIPACPKIQIALQDMGELGLKR